MSGKIIIPFRFKKTICEKHPSGMSIVGQYSDIDADDIISGLAEANQMTTDEFWMTYSFICRTHDVVLRKKDMDDPTPDK